MKKILIICLLMIFCFCGLFAKVGNKMYVSVEKAALKSGTSIFAKECGEVFYGDAVVVLEEKGKWTKVQGVSDSSISGWISRSSITTKKIIVSENKVSASAEELALAGKGLTAEIEAEYKKNGNGNYEAVEVLEKNEISFTRVLDFMKSGELLFEELEAEFLKAMEGNL